MRRALRLILGLGLLSAGLLLGWGYWNAVQPPQVVRAALPVPGLSRPVTVALLSDTHRGWPDMPAARLAAIVDQVNGLGAEAILLAGDYAGGKPFEYETTNMADSVQPFGRLRAPLGVFMVGGNHDSGKWLAWKAARMASPRLLANQWADVGPFILGGARSASDGADPAAAFRGAPVGKPRILLIHEGDAVLWVDPGATWTLSGHTHGGQIVLPLIGPVSQALLGPLPCRRGACTLKGHRLFVTSGVGTSLLPMRVGVPPEIVLLTLTPA